jgi:predicted O-methyltransferase YrrM
MNIVKQVGRLARSLLQTEQHLAGIVAGTANQTELINGKLREVILALDNQQKITNDKLGAVIDRSHDINLKTQRVIEALDNQQKILSDKLNTMIEHQRAELTMQRDLAAMMGELLKAMTGGTAKAVNLSAVQVGAGQSSAAFQQTMQRFPPLIDQKTYNTSHPDYDATTVRNYPGRIFNAGKPCRNAAYAELKELARDDSVPDQAWERVLEDLLAEAKGVPHAQQVFERRSFIEQYTAELQRTYQAHYAPGWVNLEDALFLYWLVRAQKPRTIVQSGVCNGLSSALMMLALARNGPNGRLLAVDLPPVFDHQDPSWTIKDKVYGVVIPEGKSSGWMVPDAYRDRFEVLTGDAKTLLPELVDRIDGIDIFYHDSDHTYDHMMFEFREARRKLRPGGLVVADDISWNASVWDFADQYGVPSYNFKGAVGVAFF